MFEHNITYLPVLQKDGTYAIEIVRSGGGERTLASLPSFKTQKAAQDWIDNRIALHAGR